MHATAKRNAARASRGLPAFSELINNPAYKGRTFTDDEQQILNTSMSVLEFPRAVVNGVEFSSKQAKRSDNNVVVSKWKGGVN